MGGRKNQYGYREYRGRGGGRVRTALLFIIALLAVLLAAGLAFMASMSQYLEYTPNGVIVHWPWAQESAPPPVIPSDLLEVETDPLEVSLEPSLPVEPTPTPLPEFDPIGAVTVTVDQVRGGSAAAAVSAAGGNAMVVEMKSVSGKLAWQSQVPLAATLGVNAADDLTAQAIRELANLDGLYLVARVQCFRDGALAKNWVGTLMTQGGNLWHDAQGSGWSSPADQQAVDYLSALCLELADMGFDEILVDDAGYPNFGEVHVLAVSENRPMDLTVPVSAFLQRLSGELAAQGVRLGVYTDEPLLPGETVYSGMTGEVLAAGAGRVWLDRSVDANVYRSVLTGAGMGDLDARMVVRNGSIGSWYQ